MERAQPKAAQKTRTDQPKEHVDVANKSKACLKPFSKEKPPKANELKLHTQQRASKRAVFNDTVASKLFIDQLRKKVEERVQRIMKKEEIRSMRKEMVPKAQLMPYFDKPFLPQRSNRPLTVPKEPGLHFVGKSFHNLKQVK